MASNTYSQGAQVEHQKFGLGTVMSSSEERIVIKFDDHGEKKFVTTHGDGQFEKERPAAARRKEGRPQEKGCRARHGVDTQNFEEIFVERTPKTIV